MPPPFAGAARGRPPAATPLRPQSRATSDPQRRAWGKETARHRGGPEGPSRPHARTVYALAEAWGLLGQNEGRMHGRLLPREAVTGCGLAILSRRPRSLPAGRRGGRRGRVCSQGRRLRARTSLLEWPQEAEKAWRREPGGDQIPRPPASLLASRAPRSPYQGGQCSSTWDRRRAFC